MKRNKYLTDEENALFAELTEAFNNLENEVKKAQEERADAQRVIEMAQDETDNRLARLRALKNI